MGNQPNITTVNDKSKEKNFFLEFLKQPEVGVFIPLILLIIISSFSNENFLTVTNFRSILRLLTTTAIISLGESIVIISGGIDISVGQLSGLGAITAMYLLGVKEVNPIIVIFIILAIAIVAGILKGYLVGKIGLSAFIATIGLFFICKGFKFVVTKGYPVYPLPESVTKFGEATPLGLSWSFIIVVVLYIFFEFVLRRTTFGRKLYAVGDNEDVSKLAGINVLRMKMYAYIICSILAVGAGVLLSFEIGIGEPSMGDMWELYAIAAAAVGGISMHGGKGSMVGTAIGVLFIAILNNSLVMFNVDSNIQTVLTGTVMILAVTLDLLKSKKKIKS